MKYGLIGESLSHSFSSIIHPLLYDAPYELHHLSFTDFDQFMKQKDFVGINVTMPYKEKVLPYMDILDSSAAKTGAINTILHKHHKLYGYNTDYLGFQYTLQKHQITVTHKKIIVLGNGGASKAVQAVLRDLYAKEIILVKQNQSDATITYAECYAKHTDADIIINASPVGMYPNNEEMPIDLTKFKHLDYVIDLIYNPLKTKLCILAHHLQIQSITGLDMLIAQAYYSSQLFHDIHLPIENIDEIHQWLIKKQQNIVLIGMPSSGKTTIAKALAQKLHMSYIDTDEIIVGNENMEIAHLFSLHGEAYFRELETTVIHDISKQQQLIIATGGGVIENEDNMMMLQENGYLIYIDCDVERLLVDKQRPLSSSKKDLYELYEKRHSKYLAASDFVIKNNKTISQVVDDIIKQLHQPLMNSKKKQG